MARTRAVSVEKQEAESKATSIYDEKTRKIDKRKRQSAIILVFITVLIDMLGIFLCIPILANLTREIQGEPDSCCPVRACECKKPTIWYPNRDPTSDYYAADDPNIPDKCTTDRTNANSNIGLANTMYATGTFISTFWMPKVSDRYGRRPGMILISFVDGLFTHYVCRVCVCVCVCQY
jgi:MFS family permease